MCVVEGASTLCATTRVLFGTTTRTLPTVRRWTGEKEGRTGLGRIKVNFGCWCTPTKNYNLPPLYWSLLHFPRLSSRQAASFFVCLPLPSLSSSILSSFSSQLASVSCLLRMHHLLSADLAFRHLTFRKLGTIGEIMTIEGGQNAGYLPSPAVFSSCSSPPSCAIFSVGKNVRIRMAGRDFPSQQPGRGCRLLTHPQPHEQPHCPGHIHRVLHHRSAVAVITIPHSLAILMSLQSFTHVSSYLRTPSGSFEASLVNVLPLEEVNM